MYVATGSHANYFTPGVHPIPLDVLSAEAVQFFAGARHPAARRGGAGHARSGRARPPSSASTTRSRGGSASRARGARRSTSRRRRSACRRRRSARRRSARRSRTTGSTRSGRSPATRRAEAVHRLGSGSAPIREAGLPGAHERSGVLRSGCDAEPQRDRRSRYGRAAPRCDRDPLEGSTSDAPRRGARRVPAPVRHRLLRHPGDVHRARARDGAPFPRTTTPSSRTRSRATARWSRRCACHHRARPRAPGHELSRLGRRVGRRDARPASAAVDRHGSARGVRVARGVRPLGRLARRCRAACARVESFGHRREARPQSMAGCRRRRAAGGAARRDARASAGVTRPDVYGA